MPPKKPLKAPALLKQTLAAKKKERAAIDREIRKLEILGRAIRKAPRTPKKGKAPLKKKSPSKPKTAKKKVSAAKKKASVVKKKTPAAKKKTPAPPRRARPMPSEKPERIAMPLPDDWLKK